MILNILFLQRLKYIRTQIPHELLGGAKDIRSLSSQWRRAFKAVRSFNMLNWNIPIERQMVMIDVPRALRYAVALKFRKVDIYIGETVCHKKVPLPCCFNVRTFLKIRQKNVLKLIQHNSNLITGD